MGSTPETFERAACSTSQPLILARESPTSPPKNGSAAPTPPGPRDARTPAPETPLAPQAPAPPARRAGGARAPGPQGRPDPRQVDPDVSVGAGRRDPRDIGQRPDQEDERRPHQPPAVGHDGLRLSPGAGPREGDKGCDEQGRDDQRARGPQVGT